jgi:hypothetical protein
MGTETIRDRFTLRSLYLVQKNDVAYRTARSSPGDHSIGPEGDELHQEGQLHRPRSATWLVTIMGTILMKRREHVKEKTGSKYQSQNKRLVRNSTQNQM